MRWLTHKLVWFFFALHRRNWGEDYVQGWYCTGIRHVPSIAIAGLFLRPDAGYSPAMSYRKQNGATAAASSSTPIAVGATK